MRKLLIATAVILGLVVVAIVAAFAFRPQIHSIAREQMRKVLETHFASNVEFSDFDITMFPRIHVTVTGLVLRHKGRTDIPPLIEIREVSAYAQCAQAVSAQAPNLICPTLRLADPYASP